MRNRAGVMFLLLHLFKQKWLLLMKSDKRKEQLLHLWICFVDILDTTILRVDFGHFITLKGGSKRNKSSKEFNKKT